MAKVYVGNIDRRTEKRDLEQEFGRFGKIRQIQIWADRHPAGFAFVEYEDDRYFHFPFVEYDGAVNPPLFNFIISFTSTKLILPN